MTSWAKRANASETGRRSRTRGHQAAALCSARASGCQAELALRLRRYCQESGKSANKAVMEALAQYLAEHER